MPLRLPGSCVLVLLLSSLALPALARDPWFPDGPVQPQLAHDIVLPPKVRPLQFPLKTARTLLTDAEITLARTQLTQYPSAKKIADAIVTEANYWAAWEDTALRDLVPTAEVPRAAELCNAGCPVHGRKIYEGIGGSSYPWIVDPKLPFKVKCPVGGELYPDNDYGAYYRSGFKDKSLLAGKIVDDGWGWVGPDGNRYWFVAHANLLTWQRVTHGPNSIISGVQSLARAYVLTGRPVYAHKAAILLRRIAAVYPNMNHEQQSRFGQLMREQGTRYTGKITNLIWEGNLVTPALTESYDAIWETIDGDRELHAFYGETGPEIRAFIEANYLEDAIDACFADLIRGNYGIYHRALLALAVVRQHGDNVRYVTDVVHRADAHLLRTGLAFGYYNFAFRDGQPHESPGYNFSWITFLSYSADLLAKLGYDLSELPRVPRLLDHPLDFITLGKLTPALGDGGSIDAPLIGGNPLIYQRAYALYQNPRHATFLAGLGATGDNSFTSYEALFRPALPAAPPLPDGRVMPPQPSRVLSGYGYAFLNNPADTRALGFYYGLHVSHFHYDRLHFDLFAHGRAMTPDLGYPDGANEFNSGIFTWSHSTISHNTVTVDARRQPANVAARVEFFSDGPFARALSADATATYPQTSRYRRTLVMIDLPPTASEPDRGYVVDFFEVNGGRQHDYSLHGPIGPFSTLGATFTAPAPGTLAGADVAVGALYDDPERSAPSFSGSYRTYGGSGFQHFINVRRLSAGAETFIAEYAHGQDPSAQLRMRVLPQPGQELLLAQARVSPIKFPELLNYVIARRTAAPTEPELASTFVAVLEPFAQKPFIASTQRSDFATGTWVTVTHTDGSHDLVLHHPAADTAIFARDDLPPVATDATVATVAFDPQGQPLRAFFTGGSFLQIGDRRLTAATFHGAVTAVDAVTGKIRVQALPGSTLPDPATLVGRVIHLANPLRETVHTITAATCKNDALLLTLKDDLRVGLLRVAASEGNTIKTNTTLLLAGAYRGVTVCSRDDQPLATVTEVKDGVITLTAPLATAPAPGTDLWLVDTAVGETVRLPAVLSWSR